MVCLEKILAAPSLDIPWNPTAERATVLVFVVVLFLNIVEFVEECPMFRKLPV